VEVLATALTKTKDHSNVSPAEWSSVPTLMHGLRARLTETLMSTRDQSCTRIFTIDQTHFAAVVGCPYCGFRRYCSILSCFSIFSQALLIDLRPRFTIGYLFRRESLFQRPELRTKQQSRPVMC